MTADSVWSLGDFLPEFSAHDSGRSAIVIAYPFHQVLPWQALDTSDAPEAWEPEVPESYGQDVIGWGDLRGLMSDLRADVAVV